MKYLLLLFLIFQVVVVAQTRKELTEEEKQKINVARTLQAEAEIKTLNEALRMYGMDYGIYPPSGKGYSDTALVIHLDGDEKNGGPEIKYFPFSKERVKENVFLDPWGHPYYYRNLAEGEKEKKKKKTDDPRTAVIFPWGFQIYSMGFDHKDTKTWITNYYTPKLPESKKEAWLYCVNNLQQLGKLCMLYQMEYGRSIRYPKSFQELYEVKLAEKDVFLCSKLPAPKENEFRCDYSYFFDIALGFNVNSSTTILGYSPHYENFVVVLFLDAHVEKMPKKEFMKIFEKQGAKLKSGGVKFSFEKGIIR